MQLGVSRDILWTTRLLPGAIHIICGPGARARGGGSHRGAKRTPCSTMAQNSGSKQWLRTSKLWELAKIMILYSRLPPIPTAPCGRRCEGTWQCVPHVGSAGVVNGEVGGWADGWRGAGGGGGRYDVVRTLRPPPKGYFLTPSVHSSPQHTLPACRGLTGLNKRGIMPRY
eukprot:gene11910-biopygen1870